MPAIVMNAFSLAFLCAELWLLGRREPKELPWFLAFGLVFGAALTFVS